jgi:hypothetical protein
VIVIDLPGAMGVHAGMRLARIGYRPVPLYNSCPSSGGDSMIDVVPIISAIVAGASEVPSLQLPATAPPAFLLDSKRRYGSNRIATPGMFDNRSVSLPTDFPSGNRMVADGVERAILVQEAQTAPQEDLAHTLLRWQEAGIEIAAVRLSHSESPQRVVVTRPSMFRCMWQRVLATAGLRRNPLGGFGGTLPLPSSG